MEPITPVFIPSVCAFSHDHDRERVCDFALSPTSDARGMVGATRLPPNTIHRTGCELPMTHDPADPAGALPAALRTVALVLNEGSGGAGDGRAAAVTESLRENLDRVGVTLRIPAPGSLPSRMRAAVAYGATTLIVAGGDGTVACASQMLAGTGTVLGIMPLGTMNLLAKDLGLPIGDIGAAATALAAAEVRSIDVGTIGDHVFACACMLGSPGRIARHREAARAQGGGPRAWLRVVHAMMRAVRRARPPHLTVRVGDQRWSGRTPSLTITVNPIDDASGRAFGRSRLDGGLLCAYVVCRRGAWDQLRVLLRLLARSSRDPALLCLSGPEVEVSSRRPALHVLIDGEEQLLPTPLRFAIRPGALHVLAPARTA